MDEPLPLSPHQVQMRAALLARADLTCVVAATNLVIEAALDHLNRLGVPNSEAPIRAVDSLIARALVARGLVETAGAWWHDLMPNISAADARRVLLSLMLDPPTELVTHTYDDRASGHA